MDLSNRRVLVTGGASGIGRALCVAFDAAGARVFACGSRPERVAALTSELPRAGAPACDITRAGDIERLRVAIDGQLGGLRARSGISSSRAACGSWSSCRRSLRPR